MKVTGNNTIFSESLLQKAPINYRYMVEIETSSFNEDAPGYRFSKSHRHSSKAFINANCYKPISDIIFQNFFADDEP